MTTQIILTAAPGPDGALAIHVAPVLTPPPGGPAKLSAFPALLNWPATCPRNFSLRIDGGTPVPVTVKSAMDPLLWGAIFGENTPVRDRDTGDDDTPEPIGYSVAEVARLITSQWTLAATRSSTDPVTLAALAGNGALALKPRSPPIRLGGTAPHVPNAIEMAQILLNPPTAPRSTRGLTALRAPPLPPDFHDVLAYLHDFPTLLRMLGLVLDIVAPPIANAKTLQIVAGNDVGGYGGSRLAGVDLITPVTTLSGSLAHLDLTSFSIVAINTAAAALALQSYAKQAEPMNPAISAPPLPALRTAGLQVVRPAVTATDGSAQSGQVAHVQTLLQSDKRMRTIEAITTVDAADLVRGHAVDVWSSLDSSWRSLCLRSTSFRLTGTVGGLSGPAKLASEFVELVRRLDNVADEGMVVPSIAIDRTGRPLVSDALAHWTGWSLVCRRPGKLISDPAAPAEGTSSVGISASITAPAGSLPRLRFGATYRFRVRPVDVCGQRLPPTGAKEAGDLADASAPALYTRAEPISPPTIVLAGVLPSAGESMTRIAVDLAETPVGGPASTAARWLAPPIIGVDLAEKHGMFDGFTAETAFATIQTRQGSLWSADPADVAVALTAPTKSGLHAAQLHPGSPAITWLPDLLAASVVIQADFPNAKPVSVRLSTGADWTQDTRAVKLLVLAGQVGSPASLAADDVAGVVTLKVPPAARIELTLTSAPPASLLRHIGVLQWAGEAVAGTVEAGMVREVSPVRTLDVVHAVARPLAAPALQLTLARPTYAAPGEIFHQSEANVRQVMHVKAGETGVALAGTVVVDFASTLKIDIFADYDEVRDDPASGPVQTTGASAHLATRYVEDSPSTQGLATINLDGVIHDFHDTRYRTVTLRVVATSRFVEYYPGQMPDSFTQESTAGPFIIPCTAPPHAPRFALAVPTFEWITNPISIIHDSFQTRATGVAERSAMIEKLGPLIAAPMVEGVVPGTYYSRTRLGEQLRLYLDRPWLSSGAGEQLAVLITPVDGSAGGIWLPKATMVALDACAGDGQVPEAAQLQFPGAAIIEAAATDLSPATRAALFEVWQANGDALGSWHADIVTAGLEDAYRPFMSLTVAAYQPNAIPGAGFSKSVNLGFQQMSPSRTITANVSSEGDFWHVRTNLPDNNPLDENKPELFALSSIVQVLVRSRSGGNWSLLSAEKLFLKTRPSIAVNVKPFAGSGGNYGASPNPNFSSLGFLADKNWNFLFDTSWWSVSPAGYRVRFSEFYIGKGEFDQITVRIQEREFVKTGNTTEIYGFPATISIAPGIPGVGPSVPAHQLTPSVNWETPMDDSPWLILADDIVLGLPAVSMRL